MKSFGQGSSNTRTALSNLSKPTASNLEPQPIETMPPERAMIARPLSRQGRGRKFHLCDKATPGARKPTVENIVSGVFIPVLAKHSKPNLCHWPYLRLSGSNLAEHLVKN
jgi:hypothetical protein